MKNPQEMTIPELKDYVNSLSNEELEKFENEFDNEYENEEFDVIELLDGARLYSYMQYKHNGDISIEL